MSKVKFPLGKLCSTNSVAELMTASEEFGNLVSASLERYVKGDWGTLPSEDKHQNDIAMVRGDERIMASYPIPATLGTPGGMPEMYPHLVEGKIWIITEADHSTTTILFPSEY